MTPDAVVSGNGVDPHNRFKGQLRRRRIRVQYQGGGGDLKGVSIQDGRGLEFRHELWKADDIAPTYHGPRIVNEDKRKEQFRCKRGIQNTGHRHEFPDVETKIEFLLAGKAPGGIGWLCSPSAPMRQTEGLHGGRISGSS